MKPYVAAAKVSVILCVTVCYVFLWRGSQFAGLDLHLGVLKWACAHLSVIFTGVVYALFVTPLVWAVLFLVRWCRSRVNRIRRA